MLAWQGLVWPIVGVTLAPSCLGKQKKKKRRGLGGCACKEMKWTSRAFGDACGGCFWIWALGRGWEAGVASFLSSPSSPWGQQPPPAVTSARAPTWLAVGHAPSWSAGHSEKTTQPCQPCQPSLHSLFWSNLTHRAAHFDTSAQILLRILYPQSCRGSCLHTTPPFYARQQPNDTDTM
jgi:hypothetical protein